MSSVSVGVADCASVVGAVQVEIGVAMEMTKERLAGAIKVGFAQWRVDYTPVYLLGANVRPEAAVMV